MDKFDEQAHTILIVDDQPEFLFMLAAMLRRKGYQILQANSGNTALQIATANKPDLILLDVMMPDLDGYEVCHQLKANEEISNTPVIFLSAMNDSASKLQAFKTGGLDYITKPFNAEEVLVRVQTHLRIRQQQLEIEHLRDHLTERNQYLNEEVEARTAQLDRLNHRMSAVLANVSDAILLLDMNGRISNANNGFNNMFGYLPDAKFGHQLTDLVCESYRELVSQTVQRVLGNNAGEEIQVQMVCNDGKLLDTVVTLVPIDMDTERIVCTIHDITPLKESERFKDNFVSMVTHELRTPITAMSLIVGALKNHYDRMDENLRHRKIDQLFTQAKLMGELVESVLDISRLEAHGYQSRDEIVDMQERLSQVVDGLLISAEEKNHQVIVTTSEEDIRVVGDAVDFIRIWRNLISNAIKYTSPGGQVEIALGSMEINSMSRISCSLECNLSDCIDTSMLRPGFYLVGQVKDTGHGVGSEDLPYLFTRFHRGWAKQSNIPGTGLGLALVKELLVNYGGDIVVESVPNKGSTFTFWIPQYMEAE